MPDQLTVRFEYSPREHVQALDETPYRRLLKKWWVPGSIAFAAAPFGWHVIRNDSDVRSLSALFWVLAIGVLPTLVTVLMTPTIIRRLEMVRYRRARAGANTHETRRIGSEGITRVDGEQPIPWSMITRVIESEHFYLFYSAASDLPDYVPKRVLASADTQTLRAILHEQFHTRRRDLQLLAGAT